MRNPIKMMVGMGSIDDYEDYVQAGVDEIFVGYVPHSWVKRYGTKVPLNRREVLYYNVQIGSFSELLILSEMMKHEKISVSLTFNSLSYPQDSYDMIWKIMEQCQQLGFRRYIIADLGLLSYLWQKEERIKYQITVSGEFGELNESILKEFVKHDVKRVIFPRQTTLSEMKEMIEKCPELEYEAFFLNEKCHFTGAYCNSMHCDEMCHMCKVPYRFATNQENMVDFFAKSNDVLSDSFDSVTTEEEMEEDFLIEENDFGSSGCGLCALWWLQDMRVNYLKIVSRGNSSEATLYDIEKVRKAFHILQEAESEEEYIMIMKREIYPEGCHHNCYYDM